MVWYISASLKFFRADKAIFLGSDKLTLFMQITHKVKADNLHKKSEIIAT